MLLVQQAIFHENSIGFFNTANWVIKSSETKLQINTNNQQGPDFQFNVLIFYKKIISMLIFFSAKSYFEDV